MKYSKRYIAFTLIVAIALLIKFNTVSESYQRVDSFRGADLEAETWNPLIAESVNENLLSVVIDNKEYTNEKYHFYMDSNLNIMVPVTILRDALNCSAHIYDIAAAIGFKFTTTGDTICDEQHPVILESMEFPEPVIELAIEPKTKAGQGKLGEALAKLAEEDPTFRAHTDQETGQTIIAGMGELHLEIIVDRLLREFHVEANVGAPQVAYKETITKAVDVDSKYAKQSGGRGQ